MPYFVGREKELSRLEQLLSSGNGVAISAVRGMGGIGKSELALQYIYRYQERYGGGILWLEATETTAPQEIVGFGLSRLKININPELPPQQKVAQVWGEWPGEEPVLVVIDNVNSSKDYAQIKPFLPYDGRFRVLVTSRVQLAGLEELALDLLPLTEAVALLENLAKVEQRPQWDRAEAEQLCKRLGRLPLAVKLVGSYLGVDPGLSLERMVAQLEAKGLDSRCLDQPDPTVAARGVKAAFDLSWEHLTSEAQRLGCVLAMFACEPIEWRLVQNTFIPDETAEVDEFELTDWRQELVRYSLVEGVKIEQREQSGYKLHQLIWDYLRQKISTVLDGQTRRAMVKAVVKEARTIQYRAPLADYEKVRPAIAHITEVAEQWVEDLADEDVIRPCARLAWFYNGFVDYEQEQFWKVKNVALAKQRLPQNHADIATALNNLANLYRAQGNYTAAEPLFQEALAIARESLPKNHPQLATHLNNLAQLYKAQGKYTEAEPLYQEALAIFETSLGPDHPNTQTVRANYELFLQQKGANP